MPLKYFEASANILSFEHNCIIFVIINDSDDIIAFKYEGEIEDQIAMKDDITFAGYLCVDVTHKSTYLKMTQKKALKISFVIAIQFNIVSLILFGIYIGRKFVGSVGFSFL